MPTRQPADDASGSGYDEHSDDLEQLDPEELVEDAIGYFAENRNDENPSDDGTTEA